jgi:serine/alanine adding enzyme
MNPEHRIISDPHFADTAQWASFTEKHPHGNIFNSPWMVALYENNAKITPLTLFCINNSGSILGVLVAYVMREGKGIVSFLTSRAVIWGGPLVKDNDVSICSELISDLKSRLKGKVIYLQVRNLYDISSFKHVFKEAGFNYEDHLTILFNLTTPVKSLWNDMDPTRRNQAKRALKRGITTRVIMDATAKEITDCHLILSKLYNSIRLPLPDLSVFLKAGELNHTEKHFGIIEAIFEGKTIGSIFFLVYNGLLYEWYAASEIEHYNKYTNDLLPWALIEWGSNSGYSTFDFGGAGNPNKKYGVRNYKLKFGGTTFNFGRYQYIYRPVMYFSAKALIGLREKITR